MKPPCTKTAIKSQRNKSVCNFASRVSMRASNAANRASMRLKRDKPGVNPRLEYLKAAVHARFRARFLRKQFAVQIVFRHQLLHGAP